MIEFVSDFFFRDWKARYILYGLVFICGSFYSIFNLLVLGRAEARVSYETVGLTFLLILLVPVTLFLKESKRKPLSLKILKSSRDAERRLKSLGLGLHVEGFATNELKEKSGKL